MGQVVRLPGRMPTLRDAADAFLDQHDLAPSTRRVYRASLASLVAGIGPTTAVGELSDPMLAGWFRGRYAAAAPATCNRELATVRAAVSWWRQRGWLGADPTGDLERRREWSTGPSPCSLSASATKNAVAAARSSTTMPTCSMRWIVMRSTVAERRPQLQRLSVANRLVGTRPPLV